MSISFRSDAIFSGLFPSLGLVLLLGAVVSDSTGQAASAKPADKPANPTPKNPQAKAKPTEAATAETPGVLIQLNGALESLAARVSPAVVQILVTGYGPLREENRSQTAFLVRQPPVG